MVTEVIVICLFVYLTYGDVRSTHETRPLSPQVVKGQPH